MSGWHEEPESAPARAILKRTASETVQYPNAEVNHDQKAVRLTHALSSWSRAQGSRPLYCRAILGSARDAQHRAADRHVPCGRGVQKGNSGCGSSRSIVQTAHILLSYEKSHAR